MSIESVRIECEDDGFHLVIDGEIELGRDDWEDDDGVVFARRPLDFRLTAEAAVALLEQAHETIAPWHTEGQSVLRDFEHYQRTGEKPDYLPPEPPPLAEAVRAICPACGGGKLTPKGECWDHWHHVCSTPGCEAYRDFSALFCRDHNGSPAAIDANARKT